MWPFHLPQVVITSAIRYVAIPSATLVMTSAKIDVAIPFATLSYYLSIISGNIICHNDNNTSHAYKVTVPSATVKYQLLHKMVIPTLTTTSFITNVAIPSATVAIPSAINKLNHSCKKICHNNI